MEEKIYKAFAEVSDILKNSDPEIQLKIPDKFKEMIEANKDANYVVNIDYTKSIADQKLLDETRQLIALIYRDYLCSEEERKVLIEENDKRLKKFEEKYDISNIFKNKTQTNNEEIYLEKPKKEKWYKKIINFLKHKWSRRDFK